MTQYVIEGGAPLIGKVRPLGAKNAVTKMLIAALLSSEETRLANVPDIREIDLTFELLRSIGAELNVCAQTGAVIIRRGSAFSPIIPQGPAGKNRMAVLTVAPLLHQFGQVELPRQLGGDRIGPRPINFHLDCFRAFGATIKEEDSRYIITAPEIKGAVVELPYPSVSTTENILMIAARAKGTSVLKNVAIEPEIMELVLMLQKMGSIIQPLPNRVFVVEGRPELKGATHTILPDRIVAASYAVMACATGGKILVEGAKQEHMLSFLNTLARMNAPFSVDEDNITFGTGEPLKLKACNLETGVHPGFMTDWQPPLVVLMTQAKGLSVLHETVYENRLGYTETLNQMGATIQTSTDCLGSDSACRFHNRNFSHSAIIRGAAPLRGIDMTVPDLRAGFTYVVAALCAKGQSRISNIEDIERGYGELHTILNNMGARIHKED